MQNFMSSRIHKEITFYALQKGLYFYSSHNSLHLQNRTFFAVRSKTPFVLRIGRAHYVAPTGHRIITYTLIVRTLERKLVV